MTPLRVSNRDARRLWLWSNALAPTPTGPLDLPGLVARLGFVQIDTIRNVTRAHNHIVWTRNQNFREGGLWPLLESRGLYEHFTHDASLISAHVLPYWQRRFRMLGEHVARHEWYRSGLAREQIRLIRDRIQTEGPLSTRAFNTKLEGKREMWARPPHKKALDQMWYAGELATSHRVNFEKFYDLGARVFPVHDPVADGQAVDWLARAALERLSYATTGEIARFWDALDAREARAWAADARDLVEVEVEAADGASRTLLGAPDIEERLAAAPAPTTRLRLINPFDPAVRDRARLARLFGFDYRNEMFVPKSQRRWGYYVYPLLEGDRFVGRCALQADRRVGVLAVTGLWPEAKVKWGEARLGRLEAELARFARFAGLGEVHWQVSRPA